MRKDGLIDKEGKIMDDLVDAFNNFTELSKTHPNELTDFIQGIHQCQYVLCMRTLRRDYPEGYLTYK
jgi:hypothetical protein